MKSKSPSRQLITKTLGPAQEMWDAILESLREEYGDLTLEWKVSKSDFGWMCALKQKKRTVIYLTPVERTVRVAIVLGERAAGQALASDLPESIKTLITDARPYAEGRGIRFSVHSGEELPMVMKLVGIKMAPE